MTFENFRAGFREAVTDVTGQGEHFQNVGKGLGADIELGGETQLQQGRIADFDRRAVGVGEIPADPFERAVLKDEEAVSPGGGMAGVSCYVGEFSAGLVQHGGLTGEKVQPFPGGIGEVDVTLIEHHGGVSIFRVLPEIEGRSQHGDAGGSRADHHRERFVPDHFEIAFAFEADGPVLYAEFLGTADPGRAVQPHRRSVRQGDVHDFADRGGSDEDFFRSRRLRTESDTGDDGDAGGRTHCGCP